MKNNNKKIKNAAFLTAMAFSLNSIVYASNETDLFQIKEVFNINNSYIAQGNCGGCGGQLHEEYLKQQELDYDSSNNEEDIIDDDENTTHESHNNDSKDLKECKNNCKEDFPGKKHKKHRKDCMDDCK